MYTMSNNMVYLLTNTIYFNLVMFAIESINVKWNYEMKLDLK